jgi:hypothetical protein
VKYIIQLQSRAQLMIYHTDTVRFNTEGITSLEGITCFTVVSCYAFCSRRAPAVKLLAYLVSCLEAVNQWRV